MFNWHLTLCIIIIITVLHSLHYLFRYLFIYLLSLCIYLLYCLFIFYFLIITTIYLYLLLLILYFFSLQHFYFILFSFFFQTILKLLFFCQRSSGKWKQPLYLYKQGVWTAYILPFLRPPWWDYTGFFFLLLLFVSLGRFSR